MNVRVAGPATLIPKELCDVYGCVRCDTVEQAMEGAHVVMSLRLNVSVW